METLTLIIPAYNEEACIKSFYDTLEPILKGLDVSSKYLFIDDGSKDDTLKIIKELRKKDDRVNYISFSRNFGKEAAIKAGLSNAKSNMVIIMDADLQHPPTLIPEMIEKHKEGYKIVYTRQKSRAKESAFKRGCAKAFYSIFNKYSIVPMEQSLKDYMLLSSEVVDAILSVKDHNRFFRGIFSYVGFKSTSLEFDYVEREEGTTKWNFKKLLKYGISNLNQFSTILKALPVMGFIFSVLVFIASIVLICVNVVDVNIFLILLLGSIGFAILNATLYFMFYLLYSIREEIINRPLYFIEETSLNE